MYPLKFKKHFVKKIWGAQKLKTSLGMSLPDGDNYGESWEVSTHNNGMSFIENGAFAGRSLQDLLDEYQAKLVGESVYQKFATKFPLLIKYLDINDKLSIQVHPNDEYALRVEGEFGKSETWYVIDASPDASLILGIKKGINKAEFLRAFEERAQKGLNIEALFNIVPVKKGDFINVSAGLVHASLTGSIVICETQQNSDTTYRIYDFDRLENGKLRDLHLEKAADVINFEEEPNISSVESRLNSSIELLACNKQELVRNEYFKIDKLDISGCYKDDIKRNFAVLSVLSGQGKIIHDGQEYIVQKGDTYFIPALLEIVIQGDLEILKSYL